jgi:hypothetical protein
LFRFAHLSSPVVRVLLSELSCQSVFLKAKELAVSSSLLELGIGESVLN